ncbi:hypothetical protein SESBI_06897 [Sesbania bispinosa]|nr:hypothetical protein SESBI_06897 [Sesbania bispinosa]
MANTVFTQNSTCLTFGTFSRCQASKVDHPIHHIGFTSKIKQNRCSVSKQNQGLRSQNEAKRKMNMSVYASTPPGAPLPADSSPAHW